MYPSIRKEAFVNFASRQVYATTSLPMSVNEDHGRITQLPHSLQRTPFLSPGQQVDSFPPFPAPVPRDSYDLESPLPLWRRSKSSRTSFSAPRLSANRRHTPTSTWRDLCLRLAPLALWILEIQWRLWWDVELQRMTWHSGWMIVGIEAPWWCGR